MELGFCFSVKINYFSYLLSMHGALNYLLQNVAFNDHYAVLCIVVTSADKY